MSLPGAINHTHGATADLFQNFIIAKAPLLIPDVDFGEDALENRTGGLDLAFKSFVQMAFHAKTSPHSDRSPALLALVWPVGRACRRVRESRQILHGFDPVST